MGLLKAFVACNIMMIVLMKSAGEALPDSNPESHNFTYFDSTLFGKLIFRNRATISLGALQVTPESSNPSSASLLVNQSGRVLLNQSFRLWKNGIGRPVVASFVTSFILNINPRNDSMAGEGLAFIVAPDANIPNNSYGRWMGLFNSSTDGNSSNKLLAVEFDTKKNGNDPDDNHVGIDLNSINSRKATSLTPSNIYLKSASNITAWIVYNDSRMDVYVANDSAVRRMPSDPIISYPIDLSKFLNENVYFGFSASTGNTTELNCVLSWNFTIFEPPNSEEQESRKILAIALGVGLPLTLIALMLIASAVKFHSRKTRSDIEIMGELKSYLQDGPREYKYKDLKKATNNFDHSFELGRGGFGIVYKGLLLDDNLLVAVKRIAKESKQGKEEFLTEIKTISRLRHRNLVRLLGWCHEGGELLLVYEYMANGSVDRHLFRKGSKVGYGVGLVWDQRYNVLSGVASALLYLHQECERQVIHRDLKASNIMLDSQYNARLGDFGFARLIEHDRTSYTATVLAGTPGYIAPECFYTGKATPESDVYSFGAVALEVACGRPPRREGEADLVDLVWKLYREGRMMEAADVGLGGMYDEEELRCVLMVGLACSRSNPRDRPTMRDVAQFLAKTSPPPWVPPFRPPFIWPTAASPTASSGSFAILSHAGSSSSNSLPDENRINRWTVQSGRAYRRTSSALD